MDELNPNHPVTIQVREQWHKLCAIVLHRFGVENIEITAEDVERFSAHYGKGAAVVCDTRDRRLVLRLVSGDEAVRLAREAGGLPA